MSSRVMALDDLQPEDPLALAFVNGGGNLGQLIARFDWVATPLGGIERWPQSLKTTVSLVLRSQVPLVLLWGEDGIMIYNDAYAVFAAARHPQLLGSKVREGWPEVADFNDNVMKVGLAGGTLSYRDQELTLFRSGKSEQVWMNLDYSPVLDEAGKPAGVIAIVVETTAKVAAERWLNSERERQRQMFEQAPGFIAMMFGPEHVFELTNASYMQLVGHRNVIGKSVRQALPEIAGQGYLEILDRVFETGEPFIGKELKALLQRVPNGAPEERYIDLIYQPVRNPGGDVIGIFAQGVDVTDRMLAEHAVRANEARFRTLAEALPNHVWTARPNGELDWFNPRVYEFSGARPGELDGDGWGVMVHPDDIKQASAKWSQALTSGEFYEVEFRLRRHDGTYRWHIGRSLAIRDDAGDIVQWIGTNTDIEEQKQAEQALRESERRLQLSQSAAGIASLELDVASGTVMGSEGFWDLWGLSRRESIHISSLEAIVIPEDRNVRSTEETRQTGTAVPNVEYRIKRADNGELRWLSRNIDFVFDEAGKPIKMFGVMQDITERVEAQARQKMLTHELEHRIKNILSMVSAIASQTLRTTNIDYARSAFNERLRALANAHDILNQTRWTNASIEQVTHSALAAFPSDQIVMNGPSLAINPKMALSLALAVNELATNALKYGALSVPGGRVRLDWGIKVDEDGTNKLNWQWRESGGPVVEPPSRRGFGSFLVERVLGADFSGTVQIDYKLTGVECVLTAPVPQPPSANPVSMSASPMRASP